MTEKEHQEMDDMLQFELLCRYSDMEVENRRLKKKNATLSDMLKKLKKGENVISGGGNYQRKLEQLKQENALLNSRYEEEQLKVRELKGTITKLSQEIDLINVMHKSKQINDEEVWKNMRLSELCVVEQELSLKLAKLKLLMEKEHHKKEDVKNHCVICFDKERKWLLVPCGHHILCDTCISFYPKGSPCPICRAKISNHIKVYNN
eukprot:TRINITY_DN11591_c0_g2_i1.p1 TRINITY_DN11591_c0_g2~~TRINITY_DN11591_c0_g2_i1.p1  ORF type:complete len:241 (+),score=77.76 TRINITY_DN11591_c0_g2_i1:108-725(+)